MLLNRGEGGGRCEINMITGAIGYLQNLRSLPQNTPTNISLSLSFRSSNEMKSFNLSVGAASYQTKRNRQRRFSEKDSPVDFLVRIFLVALCVFAWTYLCTRNDSSKSKIYLAKNTTKCASQTQGKD